MTIAFGAVVVGHQLITRELHSAEPDAPYVVESATPALRRTRIATAIILRRAASRVAPA